MYRNLCMAGFVGLVSFLMLTNISQAQQVERITGPYLWMIAPTAAGQGGQASTNIDSLAVASDSKVTEEQVAKHGAEEEDVVGDYEWTIGELPANGDINAMLVSIGMTNNAAFDDVSSYALITLKTTRAQADSLIGGNSDDSIKIWLNGEVVHTNAVNRGRGDANVFQDTFNADLKRGDNLLMIKVSERGGGWGMHFGVDADYTIADTFRELPVEFTGKLATRWAEIKRARLP